jgi:flagellin-like protein
MRYRQKRRGISEVIGVLLMLAIVVTLGVLIFTFASGGMNSLSENYAAAMTQRRSAISERFAVEQVAFSTVSSTLAVDGTGFDACPTAGTSCTVTITTSDTNDVVVLFSTTNGGATAYATVSSISGGGLTWQERGRAECVNVCGAGGSGTYTDTDEWYAISAAKLTGVTFTVNLASSSSYTDLSVFGINGAYTASPFDVSGGLPATLTGSASPYPQVSTSNADDIVFGAGDFNVATASLGAGFTSLGYTSGDFFADEYAIESATQSSSTVGYSAISASANNAIADAIQASPASISGADVYVRNVGSIPTTLVSVYVTDVSADAFVSQTTISLTANVGTFVDIPHATLAFVGTLGDTYSFTVTSSLGNSVVYDAEAK